MLLNELHHGGIRALLDYDNTLFDSMSLPEGIALADVVDHIIYKYGDTPVYAPDPEVIKYYIAKWSARKLPLWERYLAAVTEEYDPLHNYDRHEQVDLTHGKKVTYSGTESDGISGTYTDTVTNEISADNASTYQPDSKSTGDRTYNQYQTTRSFNQRADTNSGKDSTTIHAYGNIGVTTSQQMLAAEIDILPRLDAIDYIADDWHDEFCLSVYY